MKDRHKMYKTNISFINSKKNIFFFYGSWEKNCCVKFLIKENKRLCSNVNQLIYLIENERTRKNNLVKQLKEVIQQINDKITHNNNLKLKSKVTNIIQEDTAIQN